MNGIQTSDHSSRLSNQKWRTRLEEGENPDGDVDGQGRQGVLAVGRAGLVEPGTKGVHLDRAAVHQRRVYLGSRSEERTWIWARPQSSSSSRSTAFFSSSARLRNHSRCSSKMIGLGQIDGAP